MGIPFSDADPSRRGFVVIQIDGLTYRRFLRAMRHHQLPFLNEMVKRGRLKVQRYLSEIPTSTPAFLGGFFYGDNDNIPGFHFYDKRGRLYFRMGQTEYAHRIEKEFTNPGVLTGGSVFSSVYTGNADASLFVFSTMLAPRRWKFVFRLWDILLLSFINIAVILKIVLLAVLELFLAVYDSVRWILKRGFIRRELEFITLRIGLTIATRELITLGAVIDIYRQVPSVYANFLGYDEHAHQRGPDSQVARWTLRGIDHCIRSIYNATRYSGRQYDFFVMSDHGQCATLPFEHLAGETLGEYIQGEISGSLVESHLFKDRQSAGLMDSVDGMNRLALSMPRLFRWPIRFYADRLKKRLLAAEDSLDLEARLDMFVVSSGPLAFAYWTKIPDPLTAEEIDRMNPGLADRLACHPAIGMVSMRTESGDVLVKARLGWALIGPHSVRSEGWLPFDRSPNRQHIIDGIRRVTRFQRSGDICIWGGGSPSGNVSYSYEVGAHSGWTDDETNAFFLSPAHIDHDFSAIRRHAEFYDFFKRYMPEGGEEGEPATEATAG